MTTEQIARTDEFIYLRRPDGRIQRKSGARRNLAALGPVFALAAGLLIYTVIQLLSGHRAPAVWGALALAGLLLAGAAAMFSALARLPGLTIDPQQRTLETGAPGSPTAIPFSAIRSLETFASPNPRRSGYERLQLFLEISAGQPLFLGSLAGVRQDVRARGQQAGQALAEALGAPLGALHEMGGNDEAPGA
jgi:hypothetical protein